MLIGHIMSLLNYRLETVQSNVFTIAHVTKVLENDSLLFSLLFYCHFYKKQGGRIQEVSTDFSLTILNFRSGL